MKEAEYIRLFVYSFHFLDLETRNAVPRRNGLACQDALSCADNNSNFQILNS